MTKISAKKILVHFGQLLEILSQKVRPPPPIDPYRGGGLVWNMHLVTFFTWHASSSHFWIKWTISTWKIFKKLKFKFVQCDLKLYKDNVWGLKKYKKTTFVDLWSISAKICILKKKGCEILKNRQKMLNFQNFWLKNHQKIQSFTLSHMT